MLQAQYRHLVKEKKYIFEESNSRSGPNSIKSFKTTDAFYRQSLRSRLKLNICLTTHPPPPTLDKKDFHCKISWPNFCCSIFLPLKFCHTFCCICYNQLQLQMSIRHYYFFSPCRSFNG